jgi:hypothetical protein
MLSVVKILVIFGLICWVTAKRVPLGLSLLGGAVLVGIAFGMPVGSLPAAFLRHATAPKTLELAFLVGFILVLSHLLQSAGEMQRMVTSLAGLIRSTRIRLAILPALIGLLPMPGGALFSAPMVKEASAGTDYEAHHMTAINHWFRHVWEFCWPLYPGLMLVGSFEQINLPLLQYAALQSPLTIVAIAAGFLFVFGRVELPPAPSQAHQPLAGRLRALLRSLSPILTILVVTGAVELFMRVLLPHLVPVLPLGRRQAEFLARNWPWPTDSISLLVGLVTAILYVVVSNRLSPLAEGGKLLRSRQLWLLILMAFSIKVFAGIIIDSQAATELRDWLQAEHVPLLLIVASLPFLVGLITGITVAFVGVSFPMLLGLLAGLTTHVRLSYLVLGYACGFIGMLMSPVHVCLIAALDYFQADIGKTYRWLLPACVTLLGGAVVMHLVLRFRWW